MRALCSARPWRRHCRHQRCPCRGRKSLCHVWPFWQDTMMIATPEGAKTSTFPPCFRAWQRTASTILTQLWQSRCNESANCQKEIWQPWHGCLSYNCYWSWGRRSAAFCIRLYSIELVNIVDVLLISPAGYEDVAVAQGRVAAELSTVSADSSLISSVASVVTSIQLVSLNFLRRAACSGGYYATSRRAFLLPFKFKSIYFVSFTCRRGAILMPISAKKVSMPAGWG